MIKFPVYQPRLGEEEKANVLECLNSNWISSKGKFVQQFEESFSEYHQVNHAISVCNGTCALHLAMLTLGIGEGDEVIVPTLTYIAPVNSIKYVNATPVFVDCDLATWQMDVEDVEKKLTSKTRAILAVHVYGHPCNLEALRTIANEHGLFLIEDCAESLGSKYKGMLTGTYGDISTFSFYGNKTITTGEGGMILTNDTTLADRALHFRGQGLAKHREYWHDVIGYNFRMTNICAAIGVAQLNRIETVLEEKQTIANTYKQYLKGVVDVHEVDENSFHSYWMVTMLVNAQEEREPLREHLLKSGIETRPAFYPIHTMPMYAQKFAKHVNAESIGWRGINLPSYPGLTANDISFICREISNFYGSIK
jgi:perosamine synthetase